MAKYSATKGARKAKAPLAPARVSIGQTGKIFNERKRLSVPSFLDKLRNGFALGIFHVKELDAHACILPGMHHDPIDFYREARRDRRKVEPDFYFGGRRRLTVGLDEHTARAQISHVAEQAVFSRQEYHLNYQAGCDSRGSAFFFLQYILSKPLLHYYN